MSSEPVTPVRLTPKKLVRRDRIVDAAERTFIRHGLKAVTMEAVAEAADVSKATLYSYFPDKIAVYTAVAERLATRMASEVQAALAADGSVSEQIANALIAKQGLTFDLVVTSPNAGELLATRHHLVGEIFQRIDSQIVEAIAALLTKNSKAEATAIARTIFNASIGIGEHSATRSELETDIRLLVQRLSS